jgi:AraC family transcriptional regulator
VKPPRFETGRALLLTGLNAHYTPETRATIPAQWERFGPFIGNVPGQIGRVAYGVTWNFKADDTFDYLTGVEVSNAITLPTGFSRVEVPEQRYAVFTHDGHVSQIPAAFQYIWGTWLPQSGVAPAPGPVVERYGEGFDPKTGYGDTEFWIPVQA